MAYLDGLAGCRYVSLTTYRRDGTPVATPVWVVRDGDRLAVWTVADSWKVKRLRRNPEVLVAPCDFRGRVSGEPVPGRGEVMSPVDSERVRKMIKRKYGVFGRLGILGSRIRRGRDGTVGLRIAV